MTSAEFTRNRENYCYRHPDRQSFVLCQRCLRTICPECQTPAAVGVICPECLRAQQPSGGARRAGAARRWRARGGAVTRVGDTRPVATYWIMGITVAFYVLQIIPGSPATSWLQFAGAYVMPATGVPFEPWRMLTTLLVHGSVLHIGLNMLSLWMIGQSLEPLLGRARYLTLYLLSGLGGSVAVTLLADPTTAVIGASGAIFGLFAALMVIGRHLGANITGIAIVLGINLVIGFIPSFGISWQAHVGGLITGAAIGLVYVRTRARQRRGMQLALLIVIAIVLLAIVAARGVAAV